MTDFSKAIALIMQESVSSPNSPLKSCSMEPFIHDVFNFRSPYVEFHSSFQIDANDQYARVTVLKISCRVFAEHLHK